MIPRKIAIHHSLTDDGVLFNLPAIRKFHKEVRGWDDIAYHYILEKYRRHYEVVVGRMMNEQGAHTLGHNFDTLGICLVGNFDEALPPDDQWLLAVRLVRSLCYTLQIPFRSVYGHRELDGDRTCPGKYFDMDKFRKEIQQWQ